VGRQVRSLARSNSRIVEGRKERSLVRWNCLLEDMRINNCLLGAMRINICADTHALSLHRARSHTLTQTHTHEHTTGALETPP